MKNADTARHTITAVFAAALALGTALPALAADTLTVFDWSGYEDPAFHPAYTEKHGGSPTRRRPSRSCARASRRMSPIPARRAS